MRILGCAVLLSIAVGDVRAQARTDSSADSSGAKPNSCTGNVLSKAMCKGATKITQAALGAGLVTPPKQGTIAPPSLPIFGTYRVRLVQEGTDSLTFFVRTISPLDSRVQEGEWIGYRARFVSSLSEADLPTSFESPEARSQAKIGAGPVLFLTSAKDSSRFAINLPLMLPAQHPTVIAAKGTWLEEAIKTAPPLQGWLPKDYARASNGTVGHMGGPSIFEIRWKKRDKRFALRAELVDTTILSGATPDNAAPEGY